MSRPPSSTRERLAENTARLRRQHILDAARRVFAARGFHRATIREIAAEAGVSDGTIYNVFEDKLALLLALLDPLGEAAAPPPLPAEADPTALLRHLLRLRWAALTPEMLEALRVVLSEALVDGWLAECLLQRVIAPVLAPPEAPLPMPPATLRILMATVLGLVQLRLLGEAETTARWEEFPDLIAAAFLGRPDA
jgi:AcrR family transcriptional regulator